MAAPLVLLLTATFGCKKESVTGPAASPPSEVRLGYFANATHAQAVLGVSSGDFEKALAPSTFTTKVYNAGPELIEALNAGNIDLGYVGPGPALNGFVKSGGKGLRVIAGGAANGVVIVARPGSGISKLEDLAGKTLATPQLANTQDIAAKNYMKSKLLAPVDKVKAVKNAEQAALMLSGQIDASWAPEPWASLLEAKAGAIVIAEEKSLWTEGDFGITYVVTTPKYLQEHPDVVEKVLAVHIFWTDRLRIETERWLPDLEAELGKLTNSSLPAGVLKKAMGRVKFTDDVLAHTFTRNALWSLETGFVSDLPNIEGIVDTTILQKVRAAHPATVPVTRPSEGSAK